MTETKTLAAALCLAQATATTVAKASKNKFHGYKYASAEAVIEEARGALSGAGLALITAGWKFVPEGTSTTFTDERGKSQIVGQIGRVFVQYRLFHGASGETLEFEASTPVIPEKGRPEDKAEAGALTMNLGYFLRGLLLLPREDEGVAPDARDDRGYGNGSPESSPAAGPAAATAPAVDKEAAAFRAIANEYLRKIREAKAIDALASIPAQVKAAALPKALHQEIVAAYNAAKNALAPGAPGAGAAA